MRLTQLVLVGAALALPGAPLSAQLRSSRPAPQAVNLPRLMVANPHSFSSQDSAASVRVGAGMRERVEKLADRWYKTILRSQMNEALQQYAYPLDAVLPPLVARQLATSLTARAMVVGTILRGEGGRYTVEARLTGISDDAGQMIRVTQAPNQSFEEFGAKLADSLGAAFRALPDAKACESTRQTNREKAIESAAKAIRILPSSGLAHFCLAQIAMARKAPVDTIISHLKLATQGDPLSLDAWTALAVQYQAKGDSAATITTFKQLLRVAPTNEPLRKEAFRLFLNYGQPEAAEEVADEGLKLDPANADLWDLKSSACLFQEKPEKNRCAIDALEQVFALDTTKADTTFFTKITFAASRTPPDTARFVKWARAGVAKYPNNPVLIGQLAEAYSVAGPVDSAVAATLRLMAVDSSDVTPVLRVVKTLTEAKRARDAMALAPVVERLGSPDDKSNMSALLIRAAFPLLSPPPDYQQAADLAREVIKLSPANSPILPTANYVLGLAVFQQMAAMDDEAVKTKSCPMAQQMKTMIEEAGPALQAGRSVNEAIVAPRIQAIDQFTAHINSLIRAYCK